MHRTTIRLDERLLVQVKAYAVERRTSLTAVIEEALRVHLAHAATAAKPRQRLRLPVSKQRGGFAPGIETWDDVKRVLAGEEIEKFQRIAQEDAARRR
jgi:hypothetical protein